MTPYIALSPRQHAGLGWQPAQSFGFAAKTDTVPVLLEELPHLIVTMPIAFLAQGGDTPTYTPVALLSLVPGQNLFITANGRWLGGYTPAALRAYPFRLLPQQGQEGLVLCFDQSSGLLTHQPLSEAQQFFQPDGQPGAKLASIMQFMQKCEQGRLATEQATRLLAEYNLIKPWPVRLSTESGQSVELKGLFRIDEAALHGLSGDALHALQQGQALSLAYAQMLSQHRLQGLSKLYDLHVRAQQTQAAVSPAEVNEMFSTQDDTLKFDF